LEVGTKIDIHNNGLLGESKIERFYLDVDRIMGNFHFFPLFQWKLLALIYPVREGANYFFGRRGIGQDRVTYRTHVALPCR